MVPDIDEKTKLQKKVSIQDLDGWVAIPLKQVQYMNTRYEEYLRKQQNCDGVQQ